MRNIRVFFALMVVVGWIANPGHARSQDDSREARVFPTLARVIASGQDANGVPYSSSGTGFVTTKFGHLVTVQHLLDPLGSIRPATLAFEVRLGAETAKLDSSAILLRDVIADLLVLKMPSPISDRKWLCVLPKNEEGDLQINETRIFSSGFPSAVPYINTQGLISTFDGPGNTWLTSLPIYGGQSGSPIYTASGQVLGIAKGEQQLMPGMYAFIPISNIRSQVANFTSDCQTPNSNITVKGPQIVDASVMASLPPASECVFLGKLSALKSQKADDAPFGTATLARFAQGKRQNSGLLPDPISIVATTDVNVRSNCPVLKGKDAFYGSVTRTIKAGQNVSINAYLTLNYSEDTFFWGQLSDQRR
jgi:Trypsin-like peptidase domain